MNILVTGGAGYIGSVTVELLRESGHAVIVLDNLSRGFQPAVDKSIPFYEGNISDSELVGRIIDDHQIEACVHFAAFAYVGESVDDPSIYYNNNVAAGISFLDSLVKGGVKKLVFSSTCSAYGEPQYMPLDEKHPQNPKNPYAWSKFFMERIMEDYDRAYGLKFIALRYFNASGAIETRGEAHDPESHIIPIILQVALGQREKFSIFGDDYATDDGTCVRDYIHVADLADAHMRALILLNETEKSDFFNLGNGTGYSNLQVVEAARKITGHAIPIEMAPRRAGDPSLLIADATKALEMLSWQIKYPDLESIIKSAWAWHQAHPNGWED
ncbi:MAG: UDP-glucose 4-epimerase [Cellvibrionaceae bacterium]|jgi:UDP-glucose 4-epimerase